jgi:zinc D-Ala-D-Ala carboxypeptidase
MRVVYCVMPKKLSASFTLEELIFSQTAARKGINNIPTAQQVRALKALCAHVLQPIRDAIGKPLFVSSGFRSPELNRELGGAKNSQHLDGKAADIVCSAITSKDLFKRVLTMDLPFDQLIYEGGKQSQWVHVSYNGKRGRREILAATFPTSGGVEYRSLSQSEAARV